MIHQDFIEELNSAQIPIVKNENGSKLTTSATGGEIALLIQPETVAELSKAITLCHQFQLSPRILGNGSNVLLPDRGIIDVPVIKLGRGFKFYNVSEDSVEVGASMYLPTLSREIGKLGLSGLEFAGGIPASIGGAVRMNAGAHGGEIGKYLVKIEGVDGSGKIMTIDPKTLRWSYRHNNLPTDFVVCSVQLKLDRKDPKEIDALHRTFLEERKRHQPLQFPSFGSVFKNPEGERGSAGKLIESVGLKGFQIGNAMIAVMHANWIVNPTKNATTSDMIALIEEAQLRVRLQYGIDLEPEVIRW